MNNFSRIAEHGLVNHIHTIVRPWDSAAKIIHRKTTRDTISERTIGQIITRITRSPEQFMPAFEAITHQQNRNAKEQILNALISHHLETTVLPAWEKWVSEVPIATSHTTLMGRLRGAITTDQIENKEKAFQELKTWLSENNNANPLNLSKLHLRKLPPYFPLSLQILDIRDNHLCELPPVVDLPPRLTEIKAIKNNFSIAHLIYWGNCLRQAYAEKSQAVPGVSVSAGKMQNIDIFFVCNHAEISSNNPPPSSDHYDLPPEISTAIM